MELAETVPKRGVAEKVYRGISRVFFSDDEFERLPFDDRKGLSKTSFQGVVARTDGAIRSGTFDDRTDRHLTWKAFKCDEQGWGEVTDILADAFHQLEASRKEHYAARIRAAELRSSRVPQGGLSRKRGGPLLGRWGSASPSCVTSRAGLHHPDF